MSRYAPLIVSGLILYACQSTTPSALTGLSDPKASTEFALLPKKASLSRPPWSSDYWANARGGISLRWQAARIADEDQIEEIAPYRDYVPGQIPSRDVALLSPAEKYDLLRGDGKWTMTQAERRRAKSGDQSEAVGLNQGWAVAALQFQPVERVNLKSKSGVVVPFAADDVYALLTLASHQKQPHPKVLAARCGAAAVKSNLRLEEMPKDLKRTASERMCADLSPALFHATLVNQIAKRDEPFVLEADSSLPVSAFESRVAKTVPISAGSAPNTKNVVRVKTVLFYTADTSVYNFDEDKSYPYETETLVYDTDLDARGMMIGGRWVEGGSSMEKPLLLWTVNPSDGSQLDPTVREIYDAARKAFASARLPDPITEQPDDKRNVLSRFFGTGPASNVR